MTACAETVEVTRTRVPDVAPALFEVKPRPRLGPGDASWIDLRILGEELVIWGEQCVRQLHGVRDVLEEARRLAADEAKR